MAMRFSTSTLLPFRSVAPVAPVMTRIGPSLKRGWAGSLPGVTVPSPASATVLIRAASGTLSHSGGIGWELDTHPAARRTRNAGSTSRERIAAHSKLLI